MLYFNSVSYNLHIAKILGVCSAIFIDCLYKELEYQLRNNQNKISLSRVEIFERTGLDECKIIEIENYLLKFNIIEKNEAKNCNKIKYVLNLHKLEEILNTEVFKTQIVDNNTNVVKRHRRTKVQMHIDYLKQGVTLDNQNLKQYIFDWIDAIYTNPKGFISEQGLNLAINELIDYSNNNISIMIDILKIAIKNGYRDITWAIQNYNRNNNTNNNFVQYSNIKSDWSNIVDEAF